jgi:hypothetical protein
MPRLHFDLDFLYWEVNHPAEAVVEFHMEIQTYPRFAPAYVLRCSSRNSTTAPTSYDQLGLYYRRLIHHATESFSW